MEKNKYIVLFFTQYGAINYSRLLEAEGIGNEMKPVPRILSSSCGVCVEFVLDRQGDIENLLTEDVEYVYRAEKDSYKMIYENLD